ncbi:putative nuclease HARBI1 [Mytilus trossulus]|uniref:putative nuclease HARBI1 n=1 Tax=Mytilus trossulus TaxID=6551 RepID=UPI0030075AFA
MAAALMLRENDRFFRRERVFLDRSNPLDRPDDFLLRAYRFPRHKMIELCNELRPDLEKATLRSHSIPVELQVLSALCFYASGSFQNVIGDVFGLSQPNALVRRINQYIKFPDEAERRTNKSDFYKIAHFPNVVGVIDGTHIPIKAPNDNEYQYVNRKNFHFNKRSVYM